MGVATIRQVWPPSPGRATRQPTCPNPCVRSTKNKELTPPTADGDPSGWSGGSAARRLGVVGGNELVVVEEDRAAVDEDDDEGDADWPLFGQPEMASARTI